MAERYIPVPLEDLDKLLAKADGTAALLWLHILRSGGYSLGRASRELKCTETELVNAAALLRGLGMLWEPPERQEPPQYTARDIARRAEDDPAFQAAVQETELALGRTLSTADLNALNAIYDFWGLPADVILVLVHHCVERYQARYGPGRKPNLRYIEQEARFWANCEVRSLDDAEDLIRRQRERDSQMGQVKELLQIRGRELTKTEREYVERWLSLGFSPEVIAIAYDRTVFSTGRLTWKYMDKVLQSWAEQRLFTPEDIERRDRRRPPRQSGNAQPARSDQDKIEAMRRMLAHGKEDKHGT